MEEYDIGFTNYGFYPDLSVYHEPPIEDSFIQVKGGLHKMDFKKELKGLIDKLNEPLYYENVPSKYDEDTGKPKENNRIPVYSEKQIGLEGNFSVMASGKVKELLLKEWKPIIIDSRHIIYPCDSSRDGYIVKYYQFSEYIA